MTARDWPISIQRAEGGYVIFINKKFPPIVVDSHVALEQWLREFYGLDSASESATLSSVLTRNGGQLS